MTAKKDAAFGCVDREASRVRERGNCGDHIPGTSVSTTSHQLEFECFHKLGPKTQAVLNYALIPVSSHEVVIVAQRMGLSLKSKRDDGVLAADIKRRIKQLTGVSYNKAIVERKREKLVGAAVRSGAVQESANDTAKEVVGRNPVLDARTVRRVGRNGAKNVG